ncbi:MAG: tRNA lysidine(34) synthetase TilS [Candidatus Puniceispirillaceae bacterium]
MILIGGRPHRRKISTLIIGQNVPMW